MDNTKADNQTMLWEQDGGFKQHYHLSAAGNVIATLKLEGISGRTAHLEWSGGTLTFKPEGFFGRQQRIYDDKTQTEVARFESNWSGGHGVLDFPDGRQLGWSKTSFWHMRYVFEDKDGNDALRFDWKGVWKGKAEVQVLQTLPPSELMMLAGFGFYLMVLAASAATTAAVVSATSV